MSRLTLILIIILISAPFGRTDSNEFYKLMQKYEGVIIEVKPTADAYPLKEEMFVSIIISNTSQQPINIVADNPRFLDYGFLLYQPDGTALKTLDPLGSARGWMGRYGGVQQAPSISNTNIMPGESIVERVDFSIATQEVTPGSYDLVAVRYIHRDSGVVASEKVRINIDAARY